MEFKGIISKVLPVRTGTSSKGEWKALPFVFEYFESDDQRWSDKVLLETMDPKIMGKIGAYVERGTDGKGIVENGCMKLKREINCICGFSHSVREWTGQDGKTNYFNQTRIYKFEAVENGGTAVIQQQTGQMAAGQMMQGGNTRQFTPQPTPEEDDLPF